MPRSSNARFDENGFAEVVRDIEQLFMQLQDGTNDLNAEASNVDADVPEGGDSGGGGGPLSTNAVLGLFYYGTASTTLPTSGFTQNIDTITTSIYDTLGGFSPAGTFTAPATGVYSLNLQLGFTWGGLASSPATYVAISTPLGVGMSAATQNYQGVLSGSAYSSTAFVGQLTAGDVVDLLAAVTSAGYTPNALSIVGGYFSAHLLGTLS